MMLLLRIVPIIVGILNGALFFLQVRKPEFFPWICSPALVAYLGAIISINWKHWKGAEHVRTLIPAFVAIVVSGYGLLLTEGGISGWIIPIFVGLTTYAVLELQFLHAYASARYPANGISHVNLFLVPCLFWMGAFTSVGMTVFVSTSRLVPILVMGGLGLVLFYATSQAESTLAQRWRWTWIGMWTGILIGVIEIVLPVNLFIHGAIAALMSGSVLRARRYGIQPPIPEKMIIMEFVVMIVLLIAITATARWL